MIKAAITGALLFARTATLAHAGGHASYLASVASYKPAAGFVHVVGDTRFVGYFLAAPNRCDVTVFEARADDDRLTGPVRRMVIQIAAGNRSEISDGMDSALAIACTADADALLIAAQTAHPHDAQL
jgi:hypothetical protein